MCHCPLSDNGLLDNSFDTNGKLTIPIGGAFDEINDLVIQPDGKIFAFGTFSNGTDYDWFALRLNNVGVLDATFDSDGKRSYAVSGTLDDICTSVALQPDGKYILAGYYNNGTNQDMLLQRVNPDGTPDYTFNGNGQTILAPGPGNDRLWTAWRWLPMAIS